MQAQEPIRRGDAMDQARRIAAIEGRGEWPEAVAAWRHLVEREPAFLPAKLGVAQALIRAGRPDEALAVREGLVAHSPAMPGPWLALAVANSMLGRHEEAIAAAERAVAAAPAHAAAHPGLGDVRRQAGRAEEASAACAPAVELTPGDVDAPNKLATMRRAMGDVRIAEALLERALALAPQHSYVLVNAGTLALKLRRRDQGRHMLEDALGDPRIPADPRREAADTLAMLDEAAALSGPIDLALASNDPAPIESALRARRRGTETDRRLLAFLDRIVERHAGRHDVAARFARGAPRSAAWGAIEAHHHYLATRMREAIADSIDLVERAGRALSTLELDVQQYARSVNDATAPRIDGGDPVVFEALLRWTHARLTRHRANRHPGQFKLGGFLGLGMRGLSPRHPGTTQATMDAVLRDLMPRLPAGPVRAAFLHVALVTMQPFDDCNTRVARFLQNRLLAEAGCFPSLRPPGGDRELLKSVEATAELEPLLVSLAAGSHEAADRDREWAAHEPR